MKHSNFLIWVLIFFILSGCSGMPSRYLPSSTTYLNKENVNKGAISFSPSITPQIITPPLLNPAKVVPTQAPTQTPTQTSTAAPVMRFEKISPNNVGYLELITSAGYGELFSLQNSPSNKHIVLGTTNGVLVLNPKTLTQTSFMPMSVKPFSITFLDGEKKILAADYWPTDYYDLLKVKRMAYLWDFPKGELLGIYGYECPFENGKETDCHLFATEDPSFIYIVTTKKTYIERSIPVPSFLQTLNSGFPNIDSEILFDSPASNIIIAPQSQNAIFYVDEKLVTVEAKSSKIIQEVKYPVVSSMGFLSERKFFTFRSGAFAIWNMGEETPTGNIQISDILETQVENNLLLLSTGKNVLLINIDNAKTILTIPGKFASFSKDTQTILVDSGYGNVEIYNSIDNGVSYVKEHHLVGQGFTISEHHFAYSPDNNFAIMSTGRQLTTRIYNLNTGSLTSEYSMKYPGGYQTGYAPIRNAVWVEPRKSFLGLAGINNELKYPLIEFTEDGYHPVLNSTINALELDATFSSDSKFLAFLIGDEVYVWDIESFHLNFVDILKRRNHEDYNGLSGTFNDQLIRFSPDNELLGIRDYNGDQYFYELPSFIKTQRTFKLPKRMEENNFHSYIMEGCGPFSIEVENYSFSNGPYFLVNKLNSEKHQIDCGFDCRTNMNAECSLMVISKETPMGSQFEIINPSSFEVLFSSGEYFLGDRFPNVRFSPDSRYMFIVPQSGFPQLWAIPEN
jgi:WD40 repeat protein